MMQTQAEHYKLIWVKLFISKCLNELIPHIYLILVWFNVAFM
jgi:hypothetical protein